QQGAGGCATRSPDSLLQGVRDSGFSGRSEDGAAQLPLLHRHGRTAAESEAGGSHGKFGADWFVRAHHRDPEKGRGRRLRRGDPLLQCRSEAAQSGEGRNGALHERSGAGLRKCAQGARGLAVLRLAGAERRSRLPRLRRSHLKTCPAGGNERFTSMTVQQNTDRIQTTHIGSLPRPHRLLDVMKAKYSGAPYDEAVFAAALRTAVADV